MQKEEDAAALAAYQRQDEARVRDLSLALERCALVAAEARSGMGKGQQGSATAGAMN